jgi:DNA-directed RNA polymerase subunit RPC12/RpoP
MKCLNCGTELVTFIDRDGGVRCSTCFKSVKRAPRRKKEAGF